MNYDSTLQSLRDKISSLIGEDYSSIYLGGVSFVESQKMINETSTVVIMAAKHRMVLHGLGKDADYDLGNPITSGSIGIIDFPHDSTTSLATVATYCGAIVEEIYFAVNSNRKVSLDGLLFNGTLDK